jgi:hypothetical protein
MRVALEDETAERRARLLQVRIIEKAEASGLCSALSRRSGLAALSLAG